MVSAFAPGSVFLFFCGMMILQLIWVKLLVPETKGVPLEEIEHRLTGTTSPHRMGYASAIPSPSAAGRTS